MRGTLRSLRRGFELPARPPWGYGLLCGVAIALPLVVGAAVGASHAGGLAALGAYFTAFGDTYGKPYGQRARNLAIKVGLIAAGFWAGTLVAPHPWWAVGVVGLVAAAGGQWQTVGLPPVLATVIGFYVLSPAGFDGALMVGLGGLGYCVLALAAWPVRRLDPLKDALDAAVDAMAGMLDGFDLPEEEWAERREHGSQALDAAATASAAYHSDEGGDRSPDAYVLTLVRIFHETVALRSLRAQAGAERQEIDKVVEALSAALRQVAAGSVVGVPVALAALAGFAEHISRLRARDLSDPESLRTIALLGQVRRCLDRIAVAVRTVGLLASEGVKAPARLPRFTWQLTAGNAPEHAGRLGIAAAVAMALMVGVHEHYGKWFVFTVLIGLRPTYGDTVDRVVLRVAGTVLGAGVAALVLGAVPSEYTIVATVLVFATLGFALRQVSYGYWSVFATPLALLLTDFSTRIDWQAAGTRLLMTAGGGILALAAARVLWPRGGAGHLNLLARDLLRGHAAMIRTLAERDLDAMPDRTEAAGQSADRLRDALDRLDKEPNGKAPPELREAVTLSRKLRDDALLLAAVLRGSEAGSDATTAVLDTVADRLSTTARAVRDNTQPPRTDGDGLDALLEEAGERVDELMGEAAGQGAPPREGAGRVDGSGSEGAGRAGDKVGRVERGDGEAAGDGPSAVRRALRHAVAAHPALRTLTDDALSLTRALTTARD
ncbi:FUSC family protein [Nonomuraea typhae]|uniref:FUSC family protein n=1 Tax=Nonomuraea typhae TaxID=2603600 RepID=UPI0012F75E64|nr:FUSC family protein [Nonomuraea typhae]